MCSPKSIAPSTLLDARCGFGRLREGSPNAVDTLIAPTNASQLHARHLPQQLRVQLRCSIVKGCANREDSRGE